MRDGTALVSLSEGSVPAAESRRRRGTIRAVAVVALVVGAAYLTWRALATLDLSVWWISVPLWLLEVHAWIGLALFTFSLWDLDAARPPAERRTTDHRVAVLIPTYNEPVEVLLPTIAAAVALEPEHETWVLDDGGREEVRRLAETLGARWLARPDNRHAKAGNVNHALGVIDADVVAVLDADHVAARGFLTRTLPWFDDPSIALVQTPQDFYNQHSFEHEGRFAEQALFYRVLQAGKNRWGAAFWCGTNALVRVAALREVGGVATESVTEDIQTTIRLHRRGWRTVYHNEVLARGLAASDASQYQNQRLRWGTGAMQVLRSEHPLLGRGLSLPQRLAYAATLLGWFDAWRSLGYLVAPMAVLATGAVPIRAHPLAFAAWFGAAFFLQRAALVLLARGRAPQLLSVVFDLVRMPANLRATLTLLGRRDRPFRVTAKGRTGDGRHRVRPPLLLAGLLVASAATVAWFALTLAGMTPVGYDQPWAAYGAAFWLAFNAAILGVAIARITAARFAGERRSSVRFDVDSPAVLDGRPCRLEDVSLTGAQVVTTGIRWPHRRAHTLTVGGVPVPLVATERSRRRAGTGAVLGLEFTPSQERQRAALALALLHGAPAATPAGKGASAGVNGVPAAKPHARRPRRALAPVLSALALVAISFID